MSGTNTSFVTAGTTIVPTVESHYTIEHVQLSDVGNYHCTAVNTLVTRLNANSTGAGLTLNCKIRLYNDLY